MQPKHAVSLVIVALALGSAFLFIRVLVNAGMGPWGVAAVRTGVSLVVLTPIMYWKRDSLPRDGRVLLALAGIGMTNMALPFSLVPLSQDHISSGMAAMVSSTMPMITAVLAAIVIADERLTPTRVAGLLAGLGGVIVLMSGGIGADSTKDAVIGILLVVGAVSGYAVSAIIIRQRYSAISVLPMTYVQLIAASFVTVPLALGSGAYSGVSMGIEEWGSVLGVSVSATAMAVMLFTWLIVNIGPVRASVVTYLMPPVGVTLGWLVLDEQVGWTLLLSLMLIVFGVALVQAGDSLMRLLPKRLRRGQTAAASSK